MKKIISLLVMLVVVLVSTCISYAYSGPLNMVEPGDPPETFCLYYGWPSLVNNVGSNEAAAKLFSKYDIVVFGDKLQNSDHLDHANTVAIIARMKQLKPRIRIFGYIPMGVTSSEPLSAEQIDEACKAWKNAGAFGVFYDTCGYDYKVTRIRQIESVATAHNIGLSVMLNPYKYEWIFSNDNNYLDWLKFSGNPTYHPAAKLGPSDYFVFENAFTAISSTGSQYVFDPTTPQYISDYYHKVQNEVAYYYSPKFTLQQTYSTSYYNKFHCRTVVLDGISANCPNKAQLYQQGRQKAQSLGVHAYGASPEYWGANCKFIDYLP